MLLWYSTPNSTSTFLILGVDQRPDEQGPTRTDTILLAQTDSHDASLLSIPRDLWLPQPNGITSRINTAVINGYDPGDVDAGPRYLAQTIEANFGFTVDSYFLLNFSGFVAIIDAAGGITVDVPEPLVDPAYPTQDFGTTTVRFQPGPQPMDGGRALIYVRTRHQDSDFGRAARQQQVLRALAHKLMQPSGWPRLPAVLAAARSAIQTDALIFDLPALVQLVRHLAAGDVETLVLNQNYTSPWTTDGGAAVLLPRWDAINPQVQLHFHRTQ